MIKIPSYLFPGAAPTRKDLDDCRISGIIQASISAYVDAADWQQPQNPQPPKIGRAKYHCNRNSHKALGASVFNGETTMGGALTPYMAATVSVTQRNFYTEFRNLVIPVWEFLAMDAAEWERLSFNEEDPRKPLEYPLGEVWTYGKNPETGGLQIETSLPGNLIYAIVDERPCAYSVRDAYRELRRF